MGLDELNEGEGLRERVEKRVCVSLRVITVFSWQPSLLSLSIYSI